MTSLANIVLDLDGTIVFPEPAEISIPGRSRPSFVSSLTAHWLGRISERCNLYIATARSAVSVARLVDSLPKVSFAGYILECGLVSRSNIHERPQPSQDRARLIASLQGSLPDWECVAGYEQMICFIAPSSVRNAQETVTKVLSQRLPNSSWHIHQERSKTFLSPKPLCKVSGLQKLGVNRIDFAAGDDARYDGSLLATSVYPLTVHTAIGELVELVRSRDGFVTSKRSHAGAIELLIEIDRKLSEINDPVPNAGVTVNSEPASFNR